MLSLDITNGEVDIYKNHHFVYASGKPRILYLLRCQELAVTYYGFTPGRLGATAFSTFAAMGKRKGDGCFK